MGFYRLGDVCKCCKEIYYESFFCVSIYARSKIINGACVNLVDEQILELNEKIKDMDLDILQYKRKYDESESKLKNLKLLFEAVRSDRNLYGKNLIEATVSDTLCFRVLTSLKSEKNLKKSQPSILLNFWINCICSHHIYVSNSVSSVNL